MKLRATKEVVFRTGYSDVEKLINEVYGYDYEILPMEEIGSSQYAARVEKNIKKGELDKWEAEDVEKMKSGNPDQFTLSSILKDLANNGHIEEGKYIIDISW